jgi:hypothetical protein
MTPLSLLFDEWYKGLGIVVKHQNFSSPICQCTGAGLLDEAWEYCGKRYSCPLQWPHHQDNLRGSTDRDVASVLSSHLRFDIWRPTSFGRRFCSPVLLCHRLPSDDSKFQKLHAFCPQNHVFSRGPLLSWIFSTTRAARSTTTGHALTELKNIHRHSEAKIIWYLESISPA